jgi:hypothetical protein
MKKAVAEFNRRFSHWQIRLPADAVRFRRRGKIMEKGWVIWFLFGTDDSGEYLDYYASHRMTSDDHVRVYADGREESLPAIQDLRFCSDDPAEDARLEAEYFARNQAVARMLEEKGFQFDGDEPGLIQINRLLHVVDPRNESEDGGEDNS